MQKRSLIAGLMVGILGLIIISGCGAKVSRVNITGSTSVQPIVELLAEKFMKDNKDINVNVQGGGSSAGIKAVLDGTAEIGISSRQLTDSEVKQGLKTVEIALDGIAIAVNPQNKISGVTLGQLKKIFSGELNNWSQIGGTNKPIVVVNREEGSGTRGAFTELVMGDSKIISSLVQGSTGAVRQTVAGNPDVIGYISLAAADPSVKLLKIDGVESTVTNIKTKKYPIVRPFLFITKGKEGETIVKFIRYVLSDGQNVISENGLVSVK